MDDAHLGASIFLIIFLVPSLVIYFLPAIFASKARHPQSTAIFVLNLFLGWTFVGWIVALVWAFIKSQTSSAPYLERSR
jgi:hypothetical protein